MSFVDPDSSAFPIPSTTWANGQVDQGSCGMSLRSYFAGQAMQGLITGTLTRANLNVGDDKIFASASVTFADALIKELSK